MATSPTPATATARQQVVLIDHELDSLKALVAPLRGEFEFHVTVSASDALSLLEHRPIAAIVAGQKLFSTSGVALLTEARRRSPRTVRVLLADAIERRALDQPGVDAGGIQVLNRPCTAQQLKEVLQVAAWSTSVSTGETGEVEHVVMETAHEQPAVVESTGAPVTVLTTDANLYEAIRAAVQGRHETYLATRLEDAAELAATGRCPVLVTDMALAQPALQRIARHLGTREPALVTIVVGDREQGNALMGLLGSGIIHRFLLKPVTSGLARLAIDSAARHHQGLLTAPRTVPPPKPRQPAKAVPRPVPRAEPAVSEPPRTDALRAEPAPTKAPQPKPEPASTPRFAPSPVLAAERNREDERSEATFELTTPLELDVAGGEPEEPAPTPPRPRAPGRLIAIALAVVAVVAAGLGWWWYQGNRPAPVDERALAIQTNLAAAQTAFEAGRLLEPADGSAAHYYALVLQADPANETALAGQERIAETFVEQAENLMVEGKLDEAVRALDSLRRVRPDHRRLRFLDTQLRKEQQDRLVLQARESATSGDTRKAQELLEQAARIAPSQSSERDAARQAVALRERLQIVSRELETARQRLAQGRLVAPANDSAKSHLRAAERADPDSLAVQQSLRDLGERVMSQAAQAVERRQVDTARTLLREAEDLGAPAEQVATLRASLDAAQLDRQKDDLLQLVIRRTEENRLLEPAQDSARFYLERLAVADPQHPNVARAVRTLGPRLVANAQTAVTQRQYDSAARLISEARAIGFQGPELAAAEAALTAARAPPTAAVRTPDITVPRRLRSAVPEYPRRALEQSVEGWVDVSFLITPAGDVADVRVEGETPRSTFDRAALAAVRQWKFEPRAPEAAYRQRVRTRVEFKLSDD